STCACGYVDFNLEADDNEGAARRTRTKCGEKHCLCDSQEHWGDSALEHWRCVDCGGEECNIGVGFSRYAESATQIKWIYVGVRCIRCGILGCFAGWKVGQGNATYLLEQA